jgi:hypothetical protein
METARPASRLPVLVDTACAVLAGGLVVWANLTFMRPRAAMMQHWDEGYELAFARRMLEGGRSLPYVDGVSHRGPLFYWIVALAVKIYGFGTWMPMRALTLVSMLSALALWFVAAQVARRSLAGAVMTLGYFTVCVVGMHVPWEGPAGWGLSFNSEHLVNVFVGGALLAMTSALDGTGTRPRLGRIFLSGACVMLAALCKQIGLLAGLPFALWVVSVAASRDDLPRRARAEMVAAFVAGLVVPFACVVARYAAAGELHALFYYAIAYNTRIYVPAVDAGDRDYYLHTIFTLHRDVFLVGACLVGWGASRVFASAPNALFAFGRIPRPSEIVRGYASNGFEATVALGFILSLVGSAVGLRDFGHYYLPIVPWASLLAGLLVERAVRGGGAKTMDRHGRPARVRACVLLPMALFATSGWIERSRAYATDESVRGLFETQDWPICTFLRERTRPRDSIFLWGFDPAPYTACDRRAASRFLFTTFVSGVVPPLAGGSDPPRSADAAYVVPGSEQQLLDDLGKETPAFVFDSYETLRNRSMMDDDTLRVFLLSRYCRDLADGPNVWMRRPLEGCPVRMRPLVSYWSSPSHPSTRVDGVTLASDAGIVAASAAGYEISGGQEGYVFDGPQPGTTALQLFVSPGGDEWLTTASPTVADEAVAAGYRLVRTEGYVFASPQAGTLPLKLLYNAENKDHFTTASKDEEAVATGSGYEVVRIEGYVTRW